mgnify:CR=1 FL=1
MSQQILEFSVAQSWDGSPLLPEESPTEFRVLSLEGALRLEVDAPFYGDPAPSSEPGSTDGLWDFEVVEGFVVGTPLHGGEVPYLEIELSPHGHYLALSLCGVRQRKAVLAPLDYTVEWSEHRWKGCAWIPRDWLPSLVWKHNAYAIHGVGDKRRYLAMTPVPGEQPDFHRLSYFSPITSRLNRPSSYGGSRS